MKVRYGNPHVADWSDLNCSGRDEKGSVSFCSFVLMCVLRFGFVLFWRAGYGFIDANVNLLFVLCNNLYDNFLKRSDNTRRRKNRRSRSRLSFPERSLSCAGACFSGCVLDYFRIVGDIYWKILFSKNLDTMKNCVHLFSQTDLKFFLGGGAHRRDASRKLFLPIVLL